MKHYTVTIRPTSPFGTPIESDTLFGHICWAIWYMNDDKKMLARFLDRFDSGPPLIMSNAFPHGFVPVPHTAPFSPEEKDELQDTFKSKKMGGNLEFIQWLKRVSWQRFISVQTFHRFQPGFSKFRLYSAILDGELSEFASFSKKGSGTGKQEDDSRATDIWHNTIDRRTGVVVEGKLFSKNVTFYKEGTVLDVHIKTDYFSKKELGDIFAFISINGYGADKSTGCGRFDVDIEEKSAPTFNETDGFDSYLLLSNTNAGVLQTNSGNYTTQTKFGKLGGLFSSSGEYSPFKKPVILLKPGSVIFCQEDVAYLGMNFKDVHSQKEDIQHYGIGYPIKMRLNHDQQ